MTTQAQAKQSDTPVDEQQVIDYLSGAPDFFIKNSALLTDMTLRHESGSAISLIERQIALLRERNAHFKKTLAEMVDAVHDNRRLNDSLQRLAINLFMADGLDDVIATIDDEIRNKLNIDYFSVRIITEDAALPKQQAERYMYIGDERLAHFSKIIDKKNIQCGEVTTEQAQLFFGLKVDQLGSAAIVPIADTETYALIALGSKDELHYQAHMGTDYLHQLSALVSAAIKAHLSPAA